MAVRYIRRDQARPARRVELTGNLRHVSDDEVFEVGSGPLRLLFSGPWPSGMPAEYMLVNLRAEGLNAGDQVAVDPALSPAVFLRE